MQRISNRKEVDKRFLAAFRHTAEVYATQMQKVFHEQRQWPIGFGTTFRANGEVIKGSYRNIYDLGSLANSQRVNIQGAQAFYSWDGGGVTPAVIVHEGATLTNGRRIPARRWTLQAAKELDFAQVFCAGWQAT
jgi:hypothetical protein